MFLPLLRVLARLPLAWLHAAGAALGWIVYLASPVYASRLRENLAASGIYSDARDLDRAIRTCVAETGKGALELAKIWFAALDEVLKLAHCETWHVVETAQREGRGVIFLTPHLGCFEIAGLYTAQHLPLTALYRPPRQPWLERLMMAGRNRGNARASPANLRGVRTLYKALQRGESVGLLPDQAPQVGEGVWADFFGRPAYTMTLVRRLQKQTGAAVVFLFAERLPDGAGYVLHYERYAGNELDERELNAQVEALVRRCPTQYLWSYNRYKVPSGVQKPVPEPQT
ncbi:MAG TPA: lysophospholipid acyltransferase family protein [Burkholderiales bacterium]|nr:lysophospholipid acyltransferase family protein [Burkholderiales bacterium]